ncbi:MAG: GNAT family N-acetyltransferase [Actinomycetota bacterium]
MLRAWAAYDARRLMDSKIENDGLPTWRSLAEAEEWISRQPTRLTERVGYPFAIADVESRAARGFIGLWPRLDGSAALGYWVLQNARGRGLATRAVALVSRWAHERLGIRVLEIAVEPDNASSIRVAERTGFQLIGPVKGYLDVAGVVHNVLLYRSIE